MKHDPHLQRLLEALPRPVRRSYAWLIRPQAKWVRLPVGFALIAGGALSFLPVLGIWMVPVGALLVGEDIPPVRRVTLRVLGRLLHWWDAWRYARKWAPPRGSAQINSEWQSVGSGAPPVRHGTPRPSARFIASVEVRHG